MRPPEFPLGLTWLNSEPLSISSRKGKVILIDFWTYSCINCVRSLPHIKMWHERYQDKGLIIIGIHTPEFDFEKDPENVRRALMELGVIWPVVLDPAYTLWKLYANHAWPHQYLIDHEGYIVYDHVGEGNYQRTEEEIHKALARAGVADLPQPTNEEGPGGGVCYEATNETYLGYGRGKYGHWVAHDAEQMYEDAGHRRRDFVYLAGPWLVREEYVEHACLTETCANVLYLPYHSFSVNLVVHPPATGPVAVVVELDGKPIDPSVAGADIEYENGLSIIQVATPRLYRLINNPLFHDGEIGLRPREAGVRFYAFTFGACE